jgi:hypothetical protein
MPTLPAYNAQHQRRMLLLSGAPKKIEVDFLVIDY